MKKTMFFLLGLLIASAMPGSGLGAQNVHFNVTVRTLDHSALTSANIYAATPGQAYCVSSTQLMPSWTGTALDLIPANYIAATTLSVSNVNGESFVSGNVDSATYDNSILVAFDANGRCYVLAGSTRQTLDTGYFYTAHLTRGAVDGNVITTMLPSITMVGTERAAIADDGGFFYTSLENAVAQCDDYAVLNFLDTVRLSSALNITHPVTIRQAGKPIISTYAATTGGLVNITGTSVSWFGHSVVEDVDMTAASGDLFYLDNATLVLRQFNATVPARCVVADNGSDLTVAGATFVTSGVEAVRINDGADVSISTMATTAPYLVVMDANATGTLTILEGTAAVNNIDADAFYRSGNYRLYKRTLALAAAQATDTVFLARDLAAGTTETISNSCIIDLNGNEILGTLNIDNNDGTVVLRNGKINNLAGVTGATGTLVIDGVDSVGNFLPGDLEVEILDGRFNNVNPATGANVTINGGKFNQKLSSYLAPRHVIDDNPDADASDFTYKVFVGYQVTFVNYNAREGQPGYADSTAVINTLDNRIIPAASRPSYVGSDTIFSAYYVDQNYTTPWNFLHDVLTSDTTLYAMWYVANPGDVVYTVYHHRQAVNLTYPSDFVDVTKGTASVGSLLHVGANIYNGFLPNVDSVSNTEIDTIVVSAVTTADTVFDFYYFRRSYNVNFSLNGGTLPAGVDSTATYLFGETVSYPVVTKPGYTFTGWSTSPATMPAFEFTTYAIFTRNTYPLTWSHVDTTVVYDGNAVTDVFATYNDTDHGATAFANITIVDGLGNTVSEARTAGVYTFIASPLDTNYLLTGNLQTTLTILPATLTVSGIDVDTAKTYDGNAVAVVNNMGTLSPVYGGDDVNVITQAHFDNALVGNGKTITATMVLTGADRGNYTVPVSQVVSVNGAIVDPIVFDAAQGDNGIQVNVNGYCIGDASGFNYYLTKGTANEYKLVYSDDAHGQGFTDVDWTTITTAGTIDIIVPSTAAALNYTAQLYLRDNVYHLESAPVQLTFTVNLSKDFVRPIFNDVMTIVDSLGTIDQTSVKWYRDGVYTGVDGPYFQETLAGGLTGHTYYVTFNFKDNPTNTLRTCDQADVTTRPAEHDFATTNVKAYPNPTVDRVTVSIENPTSFNHTLRVMNVMGVTLMETTFDNDSTEIDFSGFGVGPYTVSVDGIVVRVIKK